MRKLYEPNAISKLHCHPWQWAFRAAQLGTNPPCALLSMFLGFSQKCVPRIWHSSLTCYHPYPYHIHIPRPCYLAYHEFQLLCQRFPQPVTQTREPREMRHVLDLGHVTPLHQGRQKEAGVLRVLQGSLGSCLGDTKAQDVWGRNPGKSIVNESSESQFLILWIPGRSEHRHDPPSPRHMARGHLVTWKDKTVQQAETRDKPSSPMGWNVILQKALVGDLGGFLKK